MTKIDMDNDGNKESVYQFDYHVKENAVLNFCVDVKDYLVIDDTTQETEKSYQMPGKKYGITNGGVGLFYYDGRVYQDYWEGLTADYNLKVNEISGLTTVRLIAEQIQLVAGHIPFGCVADVEKCLV